MSLGPLLVDIAGPALDAGDRELLLHPLVGGVILFTRNYVNPEQLAALTAELHALRTPPLLVTVDHEGGRVQRFREQFTALPPARACGRLYDTDPARGLHFTEQMAWLMAAELRAVGVDLSFAPVLDLDAGASSVIGDRALHRDAATVSELARAWLLGMRRAGMAACGKHFPGHGAVQGDSHHLLPVDTRGLEEIRRHDLKPYQRLLRMELPAVMMAHVAYPQVDEVPASLSRRWIQGELRGALEFGGVVFCDDLSMRGVAGVGDYPARARAALSAGCDVLPVCNNRDGVMAILDALHMPADPVSQWRLTRLHGRESVAREDLLASREWRDAEREITGYYASGVFTLT
ncbi:MAG TPA: beta-N-acetylhexosaminidase [Gammaproteobacteria bacterium]|nr:beta-N-acetylhexosaminidase [Gammaproteobacteria bacterium]